MSLLRNRTTAILVAAGLLVGGANLAAYAANGRPLLLGKINKETRSATVKNTGAGPALKLKTRASAPPLAVSSSKKVKRLNADKLDGLSSGALATNSVVYTDTDHATVHTSSPFWQVPIPAAGTYQLSYSVGIKPSSSPNVVLCGFYLSPDSFGWSSSYYAGAYNGAWLNGAGTRTYTSPTNVNFFCNSGAASFKLEDNVRLEITVTKINGLTDGGSLGIAPRKAARVGK